MAVGIVIILFYLFPSLKINEAPAPEQFAIQHRPVSLFLHYCAKTLAQRQLPTTPKVGPGEQTWQLHSRSGTIGS